MRKKDSGVYKISNTKSKKFYIGSTTVNLKNRYSDHLSQLRTNTHPNIHLQRSYNKHGEICFVFEILKRCENVLEIEQYYIDTLKPHYNICKLAKNSQGTRRSKETCAKIGFSKLGNQNRTGQSKSFEERKSISDTLKQKYKSGEIIHPMKGKKHKQETIELLKAVKAGKNYRMGRPIFSPIVQYNISGEFIQTFESAQEAVESLGLQRKSSCHVIKACRQETTAYGFKWTSPSVQVKSGELLESLK
jgi:group I intron endonuclease